MDVLQTTFGCQELPKSITKLNFSFAFARRAREGFSQIDRLRSIGLTAGDLSARGSPSLNLPRHGRFRSFSGKTPSHSSDKCSTAVTGYSSPSTPILLNMATPALLVKPGGDHPSLRLGKGNARRISLPSRFFLSAVTPLPRARVTDSRQHQYRITIAAVPFR